MKPQLSIKAFAVFLLFLTQVRAESLPKITPEFISEVQRVCFTLDVASFPMRQGDMQKELDLPRYTFGLTEAGAGKPTFVTCPISDTDDSLGYYALRIYFGLARPDPNEIEVTKIEVAYIPRPTSNFPPFGAMLYVPHRDPYVLVRDRLQMWKQHLTAAEYVRSHDGRLNNPKSPVPTASAVTPAAGATVAPPPGAAGR